MLFTLESENRKWSNMLKFYDHMTTDGEWTTSIIALPRLYSVHLTGCLYAAGFVTLQLCKIDGKISYLCKIDSFASQLKSRDFQRPGESCREILPYTAYLLLTINVSTCLFFDTIVGVIEFFQSR